MARRRYRTFTIESLESRMPFAVDVTHRIFGLNFSPYIAPGENPSFGAGQVTAAELRDRLANAAPYADWIRTFSTTGDLANASQIARELGKKTAIGAWIGRDGAANQREIDALVDQAIFGNVDVAIVGSEVILRGDATEEALVNLINQVRTRLRAAGVSIPVTTADTYHSFLTHRSLVDNVDVVFANYYPFWEGEPIETAMASLNVMDQRLRAFARNKEVVVSETGWPSAGSVVGNAVPSPENAAYYFLNFESWRAANGRKGFYFEFANESWKTAEGTVGPWWGITEANMELKPGMERVFRGETMQDNWSAAPAGVAPIDFASMPSSVSTNIDSFVVSGIAGGPDDVVLVNGVQIPAAAKGKFGEFAVTVPLVSGSNTVMLTVRSVDGQTRISADKTIFLNTDLSTGGRRLLYVDVVPGENSLAPLDGTVVLDLDLNLVLGILSGRHVRGISPDGAEIYMSDRSVLSTNSHKVLRKLPFSQDIPSNGFLVSPRGDRLYSRREVVDVTANSLMPLQLSADISTGGSWDGASIPGGPGQSPDGKWILARDPVVRIDTTDGSLTQTKLQTSWAYLSDIAVTPDGKYIALADYGGGNALDVYDVATSQLVKSTPVADFIGEIDFLRNGLAVIGSSGNAASGGGRVVLYDFAKQSIVSSTTAPLADNLTTNGENEIFVSVGNAGASNSRLGIDNFVVTQDGRFVLTKSFNLGVNVFETSIGRPRNDQIRRVVYKAPAVLTISYDATSLAENAGFAAIMASVRRSTAAATAPLAVFLTSDFASRITLPPTVVIPGGAESVQFSIGAIDNAEADGALAVTISANAEGFEPDTRSILLLDDELLLHNGVQPLDVDNDGIVVPLDALLIINALITFGGVPARDFVAQQSGPTVFLDTTGDDWVSPRDALLVVNALTAAASAGEGEQNGAAVHLAGCQDLVRCHWPAWASSGHEEFGGWNEFQRVDVEPTHLPAYGRINMLEPNSSASHRSRRLRITRSASS